MGLGTIHFFKRYWLWLSCGIGCTVFFVACSAVLVFTPPLGEKAFYPQVFVVSKGDTIREVAESLAAEHLISSPSLFIVINELIGGKILWGSYYIADPKSIYIYAKDFYTGSKNAHLQRVVVPEGSNLYAIAEIFEKTFPHFDREAFERVALEHHGYLYPDTYFLASDDVVAEQLVAIMAETFSRRTQDLFDSYEGDLTRDEIVTLASIVELEAHRWEDRRRIARVLFNRLDINLPLQVDVSFLFISGKNTFMLSRADLRVNDPSNTYKYAGIPPIPITNPSRRAIEAVLDPAETDAIFFLADFYGNTYFSRTYAEHLRKKELYIDSVLRASSDAESSDDVDDEDESDTDDL